MELLILVVALIALGVAANLYGADSRDGLELEREVRLVGVARF
jgi:hypothetical protein